MKLHALPKTVDTSNKIVGRGHGSGRGKTAGRGTKGQKARRNIPLYFEGGALKLIKRLPMLRGNGRNKVFMSKPIEINVGLLEVLGKNATVDFKTLISHKLVTEKEAKLQGVKILGNGELTRPLTVKLPVTKGARLKIEKAGGTIEE